MTSPDTMAQLRLADRSLRRYATHLGGGQIDQILRVAYVMTARQGLPIVEGNKASLPLFQEVHASLVTTTTVEDDDGSGDLGRVLRSVPGAERGALLLTSLEGLTTAETARVLAVPEPSVIDLVGSARDAVRDGVPSLRQADPGALGRALGDLPVSQATPTFWEGVEAELHAAVPTPPSVLEPTIEAAIVEPELSPTPPPPPRESIWPAIWAGVGAVAVIALIVIFLVSRSGDSETATDGTTTTGPTTTGPTTTGDQTTTTAATDSTTASTTAPTTTAPPTTTTSAPTTTTDPTTAPPTTGGVVDRGGLPLSNGLAIIDGSVAPGSADVWRADVAGGQTLTIAVPGLGDVGLAVTRSDGSALTTDYADEGLLVFTEPGSHLLRFSNGGGSAAGYSVGVGLAGPGSGFLANLDERGTAVSTLAMTSCEESPDRLEAALTGPDGQQVSVTFTNGADDNRVTWLGSTEAEGRIEAASNVPTGVVFSGSITVGRDTLLGLPFWLGVYGCSEVS